MLYLYLTESIHLKINIMNEDTKRPGVDIIGESLIPRLEEFRTFVMGSIKSMSEGTNLDSECLDVFGVSEKDQVLNKEKERLKTNSFLRGENLDLSITSK